MKWNIKDHGESIEKLAAKQLEPEIVSAYNKFWGTYIGHKKGAPINIPGLIEQDNRTRLKLGQWCYTLLQNQLFIALCKTPVNIRPNHYLKIATSIRTWNECTHLLYNSIELAEDFNADFPTKVIPVAGLLAFKDFRNVIAHNFRPPISFPEGQLIVPKNFEVFKHSNANERRIWTLDEPKSPKIQYWTLAGFKSFVFQQNKQLLFQMLDRAELIMKEILPDKTITWHEADPKSMNYFFVSGSTEEVHVS